MSRTYKLSRFRRELLNRTWLRRYKHTKGNKESREQFPDSTKRAHCMLGWVRERFSFSSRQSGRFQAIQRIVLCFTRKQKWVWAPVNWLLYQSCHWNATVAYSLGWPDQSHLTAFQTAGSHPQQILWRVSVSLSLCVYRALYWPSTRTFTIESWSSAPSFARSSLSLFLYCGNISPREGGWQQSVHRLHGE